MKKLYKKISSFFVVLVFATAAFSQDQCLPVGWAAQNGGVTGGGNATPTVVTTYNTLKNAVISSSVKVIHISGTIVIPSGGKINFQDQSGKTIFGLPGARLVSEDLTADGSGILYAKRCTNIILRNIVFEGPGAYDVDGNDNLTIESCSHVWIDHCEFQDGMDGNLDIKTASDFVSVTWCKFIYNKAPIAGGSGGSNDHRFSNLLGSSDDAIEDRGHLNITLQYCWWAQGCKARMPRVRFGKVHVVNNFFSSTVSTQCVMAGFEADLLVENNVFENVHTPIDPMAGNYTAITSRNNIFSNTTGNTTGDGVSFTPPYTLNIIPSAQVKALVSNHYCGAGATLINPASCGCNAIYSITTGIVPSAAGNVFINPSAPLYPADSVVTLTATPAAGYEFIGWSGDVSATDSVASLTVTRNETVTANFQPLSTPVLSADAAQPTYAATSAPYLTIIAGSGKTSYVSGVLDDPTDPAATAGIAFTITGAGAAVAATSSDTAVVRNSDIIVAEDSGKYFVRIIPNGVGYTTISLKAVNSTGGSSSVYKINYAASAASLNPPATIFHTGTADASAALAIDSNYVYVADDENNLIRTYSRQHSGKEWYALDISAYVGVNSECDLESSSSSVRFNAGNRLYWCGSMGNSKDGDLKPETNKIIATEIIGNVSASVLLFKSYSNQMRPGLISWGNASGWNFTASAASGVAPKRIDGFNVEALTVTHRGDTAYLGFRAPCVPLKGISPDASNRQYAVLAPVYNFETMLNGNREMTIPPVIGEPVLFDFEGLGFRSMEKVGTNKYLIVAGLYKGGGRPAVYLWDGVIPPNSGRNPISVRSAVSRLIKLNLNGLHDIVQSDPSGDAEGFPEAMIADMTDSLLKISLISDNGPVDFYNDGTEAKDLSHKEFKKFRDDKFVIGMDTIYGTLINLCPGSASAQLSSNLSGAIYQWQWDTCGTGCYTNIFDNGNITGADSKYLSINNVPTAWSGYHFRPVIDGTNGTAYTIKFSLNWTGAIDNNWETPGNWDCNHLPDAYTDVYIKNGSPVLHTSTEVKSLEVSIAANFFITMGNNLLIKH